MVKIIGKYPTSVNESPSPGLFWHQIWIDGIVLFLLAGLGVALCHIPWNDRRKLVHPAITTKDIPQDLLILNGTAYQLCPDPSFLVINGSLQNGPNGRGDVLKTQRGINDTMGAVLESCATIVNGTTYIETQINFGDDTNFSADTIRQHGNKTDEAARVSINTAYEGYGLSYKMDGLAFVFGLGVPILVVLLCQTKIRSFWDAHNAILGLFFSTIGAFCFVKVVRLSIAVVRAGYWNQKKFWPANAYRDRYNEHYSLSSNTFPSTFSAVNCAGLIFLFLYFNAKLKVWANYRPSMWKLAMLYVPVLGAFLLLLSEIAIVIDIERHIHLIDWYDSLFGALIGVMFALSAYRMAYASIFNFEINHIPLSPRPPHISEATQEYQDTYHSATLANRGGWGSHSHPNLPAGRTPNKKKTPPHCGHPHCEELHKQSATKLWKYQVPERTVPLGEDSTCDSCSRLNCFSKCNAAAPISAPAGQQLPAVHERLYSGDLEPGHVQV